MGCFADGHLQTLEPMINLAVRLFAFPKMASGRANTAPGRMDTI